MSPAGLPLASRRLGPPSSPPSPARRPPRWPGCSRRAAGSRPNRWRARSTCRPGRTRRWTATPSGPPTWPRRPRTRPVRLTVSGEVRAGQASERRVERGDGDPDRDRCAGATRRRCGRAGRGRRRPLGADGRRPVRAAATPPVRCRRPSTSTSPSRSAAASGRAAATSSPGTPIIEPGHRPDPGRARAGRGRRDRPADGPPQARSSASWRPATRSARRAATWGRRASRTPTARRSWPWSRPPVATRASWASRRTASTTSRPGCAPACSRPTRSSCPAACRSVRTTSCARRSRRSARSTCGGSPSSRASRSPSARPGRRATTAATRTGRPRSCSGCRATRSRRS